VTWPFLYYTDDRLSQPELMAARLDGHLVEIGDAFMPADAVETRELRAGSLAGLVGSHLALTHESAAWVHGALHEPPARHSVQRCVDTRIHHVLGIRLRYRDLRLPEEDGIVVAGVTVATPVRTLVDLLRDRVFRDAGDDETVRRMISWRPELVGAGLMWLDRAGPVQFKRPARDYLEALEITKT
jgi:hypothetical protein